MCYSAYDLLILCHKIRHGELLTAIEVIYAVSDIYKI